MRPSEPWPPAYRADVWAAETPLGEGGLGLDSLERMQLAAALSEALHMHRSGVADHLLAQPNFGAWCDIAGMSLGHYSAAMTMRTSGSSGAPKPVVHQLADLEQEVRVHVAILAHRPTRILSAVPRHHVYGFLFTVLLPCALGGVPVLDLRRHSPAAMAALAAAGDLVIAFPDYWAAAVRAAPRDWPADVTGVTSTAPMGSETASALAQAGLRRLVQIHGSTETAGLGWRDDPNAPYTLMPTWARDGDQVRRVRTGPDGAVGVGEPVAPPDRLEWTGDRRYRVLGRADGAVQVAGVNVFPAQVARVLGEHPGVAEIAVRLMRPAEGVRLKAYVVPRAGFDERALLAGLHALARQRLDTPEQPRCYNFGPALPRDGMGKSADWPVARPDQDAPA